jgi:transcription factor MBP1
MPRRRTHLTGAPNNYAFAPANGDRAPLHHSSTAQRASTKCVNEMADMLDNLAASFDTELREKERSMNQANALLANIQGEILESQRAVTHLQNQAQGLPQVEMKAQGVGRRCHDEDGQTLPTGVGESG